MMPKRKRSRRTRRSVGPRRVRHNQRAEVLMDPLMVLEDDLTKRVLSFLGVATLVGRKQVNKKWRDLCTAAINAKCPNPKCFESNEELCDAVEEYCTNNPKAVEKLAVIYAYPINKWKVSLLTDFSFVFHEQTSFNESLSLWDVSNGTEMIEMFLDASSFNQDISYWETSRVERMRGIFMRATSFNQDISSWNTSRVTTMTEMFEDATSFNQDISTWDVSRVTKIDGMFRDAKSFNQDISTWNTGRVRSMQSMFANAESFNQDISSWDTGRVRSMRRMFNGATSLSHKDAWIAANETFYESTDVSDDDRASPLDFLDELIMYGIGGSVDDDDEDDEDDSDDYDDDDDNLIYV